YSHDYPNNFAYQEFLPDEIQNFPFYEPGANAREQEIKKFITNRWNDKYDI
ncbi:MAG: replication-associated recombination protein A, partial [Flavobacterium sp.]|nr:replication-associated recombination protein A [Candidatus Neoflavobacterium equi]